MIITHLSRYRSVIMNRRKYQTLVSSHKTSPKEIEQLVANIHINGISQLFDFILTLEHALADQLQPHPKLNAILSLLSLLKKPTYPIITILELIFVDLVKEPAKVAASNSQTKIYQFFESTGVKSTAGNIQSLSYHFTHCCLDFVLLLGYVKPKVLYRNKESSAPSKAKRIELQLKEKVQEHAYTTIFKKYDFLSVRKAFVTNLIEFNRSPHAYIDFFMQQIQQFVVSSARSSYFNWFKSLAKSGEVYLTSEALARLADIFCFHKLFSVKRNALQLISEMVYYGDLEALLIINFTEYFSIIGTKIIEAQQKSKKLGVFCIFPQIDGQGRQKQLFLHQFLLCIRRIASVFPSLESYFLNSGQSPIYQLYVKLLENGTVFPNWEGQEQYQMKILSNFRNRKQLNEMFLQQLDKQKGQTTTQINPFRPTLRGMSAFYQRNKENLQKFLKTKDLASQEWGQLVQFRKHFEEYLQRMGQEGNQEEVEALIEDGLELQSKIQHIEQLALRFKQGNINQQQFIEALGRPPRVNKLEQSEKASSIKESMRSREKDSIKYKTTQSTEAIKEKMNVKINQLVQKRSEIPVEISQLQIFSRPYLANQLHSKQISDSLIPLLQLHPLRKEKRSRRGIKIVANDSQQPHDSGTPKFRSLINVGSKKGIKLLLKSVNKYQNYVNYLDKPQDHIYMSNKALNVVCWGTVAVSRTDLRRNGDKLEITYTIGYPSKISELSYEIIEEPNVRIDRSYQRIDDSTAKLTISAQFIKFGFNVSKIQFSIPQKQPRSLLLPFALHNFLKIGPVKPLQNSFCQQWAIPYHLKKDAPMMIEYYHNFFDGLSQNGRQVCGRVELKDQECNLWLGNEEGRLVVEIESGETIENNVLGQLIPLIATKLFTNCKDAPIE